MKVRLLCIRQPAYESLLRLYAESDPPVHTLVEDEESADLILFAGGWGPRGEGVADNPIARKYPEKTFIYRDEDGFVPLLPGIYPSAERPRLFNLHRVEAQRYISTLNPNIHPLAAEKKYLFSFAGASTSLLRKRLYKVKFKRSDVKIENTSNYFHWDETQPGREERQRKYAETIASSHFALCPRGASAGSYRLYEVMEMGVCPVILSDRQMLPYGPDWERCSIRVPERRMKDLEKILSVRVDESAALGAAARAEFERWFRAPVLFNHMIAACERERAQRRIPERWIRPLWGLMLWRARFVGAARGVLTRLVLLVFRMLGRKFVYDLNQR